MRASVAPFNEIQVQVTVRQSRQRSLMPPSPLPATHLFWTATRLGTATNLDGPSLRAAARPGPRTGPDPAATVTVGGEAGCLGSRGPFRARRSRRSRARGCWALWAGRRRARARAAAWASSLLRRTDGGGGGPTPVLAEAAVGTSARPGARSSPAGAHAGPRGHAVREEDGEALLEHGAAARHRPPAVVLRLPPPGRGRAARAPQSRAGTPGPAGMLCPTAIRAGTEIGPAGRPGGALPPAPCRRRRSGAKRRGGASGTGRPSAGGRRA